ncbi:MAG: 16S rRNA (adenine(1518)-N(6)/adenine(1519)-N(6))-dimethyltransferase RsmA [Desulfobacteraceae bacterium]
MGEKKRTRRGDGVIPKKRLGQHFLRDTGVVHKIISKARLEPSDQVLEIGPGLGALTVPLAPLVHHIVAVEKDPRLAEMLKERLAHKGISNVLLINDDILSLKLEDISQLPDKKMKVIGNLPYNISTPFLERLVANRNLVSRAVLMFQLELARRLSAVPGNKEFGAMTVLVQYHAHISLLLEVSKASFYPKPKVDSTVLELDFERPHPRRAEDETKFKAVVRGAFAYRRKTLLNSLKRTLSSCTSEEILAALRRCGIDPEKRAETLHIDQFLCLTSTLPTLS